MAIDDLQNQSQLDDSLLQGQDQDQDQEQDANSSLDSAVDALTALTGPGPTPAPEASELTAQGKTADSASDQAMGPLAAPSGGGRGRKARKRKAKKARAKSQAKAKAKKNKKWTGPELATLVSSKTGIMVLRAVSGRDSKNGVKLLKTAGAWDTIVAGLPQGDALARRDKIALLKLVTPPAAVTVDDAKKLFAKRFKHAINDSTGSWTLTNIHIVWKQINSLPESDLTNNTIVTTFQSITGGGGFGPSWEAPDTVNTIELGEGSTAENLPHTVRHEVGHGVHAQIPGPINAWLKGSMDMWFDGLDDGGTDKFINDLGGYPAKFNHPTTNAETDFNDSAKGWVKNMIQTFTGTGKWDPTRAAPDTGLGVWQSAWWAAMDPKLKNACAQSTSHWYNNYMAFQKGDSGNRVFLNHYYHRWFRMSDKATAVVTATAENYTAMSEKEFFANAYAEYFKDPKGKKDNSKWGGTLPGDVKDFFKTCIVQRDPYNKFVQAQKKKET